MHSLRKAQILADSDLFPSKRRVYNSCASDLSPTLDATSPSPIIHEDISRDVIATYPTAARIGRSTDDDNDGEDDIHKVCDKPRMNGTFWSPSEDGEDSDSVDSAFSKTPEDQLDQISDNLCTTGRTGHAQIPGVWQHKDGLGLIKTPGTDTDLGSEPETISPENYPANNKPTQNGHSPQKETLPYISNLNGQLREKLSRKDTFEGNLCENGSFVCSQHRSLVEDVVVDSGLSSEAESGRTYTSSISAFCTGTEVIVYDKTVCTCTVPLFVVS